MMLGFEPAESWVSNPGVDPYESRVSIPPSPGVSIPMTAGFRSHRVMVSIPDDAGFDPVKSWGCLLYTSDAADE